MLAGSVVTLTVLTGGLAGGAGIAAVVPGLGTFGMIGEALAASEPPAAMLRPSVATAAPRTKLRRADMNPPDTGVSYHDRDNHRTY